MINVQLYNVAPKIPEELRFLEELSYNMWWCWNPTAAELFVRVNPELWRATGGNSRKFLNMIPQSRLEELAGDKAYLRLLKQIKNDFQRQVAAPGENDVEKRRIAYFSMEFGIHESIRLYSGGLGVLAGDHLKAASDMKLPIVGVGLLYRQGYFRQFFDRNGWQLQRYPENEIHNMPLIRACDKNGEELFVTVKLMDRELVASVWTLHVGNVPLVLLDTELPQNPPEFREITGRLYGGDRKMRLQQELLLGVGGFKALIEMGYDPAVCHMNEGHAAFLGFARIGHMVKNKGLDPETALEVVWRSNVFTTHTPVPAGNEVFDFDLAQPYLEALKDDFQLDTNRMINWGVPIENRSKTNEMCMTVLGLRMANFSNGVSKLHGEVAREMWRHLWPGRAINEIPIKHITNGVHIASWVAARKRLMYNRYLSLDWAFNPNSEQLRNSVYQIPAEELWMTHQLCRHSLVRKVRQNIQQYFKSSSEISQTKNILDPDILTIGFARRFAAYKRGTLLLRNRERLKKLLTNPERPVQLVFAGKAHPADDIGKKLIQELISFSQDPEIKHRIVFLDDYDIALARTMLHGVDVWLNTPRRPQEASGTSGMKAAANGVLNCSILDGWWAEAYESHANAGWAIVGDENYEDPEDCDNFESHVLFNLLEREIVPCFYERSEGDLPLRWIGKMKEAIIMALGAFSSMRMVQEYEGMFYQPALNYYDQLVENDAALARSLVEEKAKLIDNFGKISIQAPVVKSDLTDAHVGDCFEVAAKVFLNELDPTNVAVQLYYGQVNTHNEVVSSNIAIMTLAEDLGEGNYLYQHRMTCSRSGRFGLTARIVPAGENWTNSMPGFICWPENH